MAFIAKEWKNRLVEYAGRRRLTIVATGESFIADVERNEGTVSQEGDAFSPKNMNDMEQRVKDAFDKVDAYLLVNTTQYAEYSLATAIGKLLAGFTTAGTYSGRFKCVEGWYTIHCYYAADDNWNSGYVSNIANIDAYTFNAKAGADAVLKKLGNARICIPYYKVSGLNNPIMYLDIKENESLSFKISKEYYNGYKVTVSNAENYADISSDNSVTVAEYSSRGAYSHTIEDYDVSDYNWLIIAISGDSTNTNITVENLVIT